MEKGNLKELSKKLIEDVLDYQKKNVFNTPIIIFPNLKLEQWFKTFWLKTKRDIYFNIKCTRFSTFMWSCFDKNDLERLNLKLDFKELNIQELKNLIIDYISKEKDTLIGNDDYKYVFNGNELDPIKLYDFSKKLATLFIAYEKDCYEFDENNWQKKLYDEIMSKAKNIYKCTIKHVIDNKCEIYKKEEKVFVFSPTPLSNLEELFLSKYNGDYEIYTLDNCANEILKDNKDKLILAKAPSMMREIEYVHGEICKLTLNENDISFSDILVFAPDISIYENAIKRVFEQDDKEFPNIPYNIISNAKVKTDVAKGLKVLFDIYQKGYATRNDLSILYSNADVKRCRNITDEDIAAWNNAIINTNSYRNSDENDDWDDLKKRLLIYKLVGNSEDMENLTIIDNDYFLPYSSLDLDDNSITKFICLLDDIKSYINLIKENKMIKDIDLNDFIMELRKWFSFSSDANIPERNLYFKDVLNIIEFWNNNDKGNIPLNTLFYSLLDASETTTINKKDAFTSGVTFLSFDSKCILSSKYIFFIGCSSNCFPPTTNKDELDLNDSYANITKDAKNTFYKLLNNCDKFYCSYVYKELKTDEDFYPSSIISKNYKEQEMDKSLIILGIDENRTYDKLYTKVEYRKREFYDKLNGKGKINANDSLDTTFISASSTKKIVRQESDSKLSLTKVKDFLQEPLHTKASLLFGTYDDEVSEKIKEEFEPLELDSLGECNIKFEIIKELLKETPTEKNDIKEQLMLTKLLPSGNFGDIAFDKTYEFAKDFVKFINDNCTNPEVTKLEDCVLTLPTPFGFVNQWTLICNKEICRSIESDKRIYIELKDINKANNEAFLVEYVFALMDIALINDDQEYNIQLLFDKGNKEFKITAIEARSILNEIYKRIFDYENYNVAMSLSYASEGKSNFENYVESITGEHGSWSYYEDKKIFNRYSQLGLNKNDFNSRIYKEIEDLITYDENGDKKLLIKYLGDLVEIIDKLKERFEHNE